MPLKLAITLGGNAFDIEGDFEVDQNLADVFRVWINAQQTTDRSPEALEAATLRLRNANNAAARAVTDNTPSPGV